MHPGMIQRCQPSKKLGILRKPPTSAVWSHAAMLRAWQQDRQPSKRSLAHLSNAARQALEHVVMGVDKSRNDNMVC